MRWRGRRRSDNLEDRRGASGGMGRIGVPRMGGGAGRAGGIGVVGAIVVVVVLLIMGVDPTVLLQGGGQTQPPGGGSQQGSAEQEELKAFVSVVLADTEDTWHMLFEERGETYSEPRLVLFTGAVQSGCGFASAAVGPFYCPPDRKVYLDLDFFDELHRRFGAPGDFAQAYVIAHEVGHHVQTLLGISDRVRAMQAGASREEANQLSVRMELQADCLAGIWAHHAERLRDLLEAGDIEEGLRAASAIGDDAIQRQTQGHVVPDSFTHGSSAQRVRWFRRGVEAGSLDACDTFSAKAL